MRMLRIFFCVYVRMTQPACCCTEFRATFSEQHGGERVRGSSQRLKGASAVFLSSRSLPIIIQNLSAHNESPANKAPGIVLKANALPLNDPHLFVSMMLILSSP